MLIAGGTGSFQRAAEDIDEVRDLRFGGGCGWNETQHAAAAAQAEDDAVLEADAADLAAFFGCRLAGGAVADKFDAGQLAAAAHVADHLVALGQRFQALAHLGSDPACLGGDVLLLDHVQAGDASGADQRVVGVRVSGCIAGCDHLFFDRSGGGERADADTAAEMLGHGDDVRHDAFGLEAEHVASLPRPVCSSSTISSMPRS